LPDRWDPTSFIPPFVWAVFILINIFCFLVFLVYKDPGMMIWHLVMMLFCKLGHSLSKKNRQSNMDD